MSPGEGATSEASASRVAEGDGRGWVRRLGSYVLVHRRNVVIAFSGAIVGSLAQVIVPLIERQIVDNVILRHSSPLAPWLVTLLGLGVVTFVGAYFRRYRGGRVALDVQYDLRNAMQEHLQRLDFANLDRMPTGQLVARANSDSMLVQGLLSFLPIMSGNILMLVLSLAVMLYLSPLLALVSVILAPALLFISYRMRWRVFPATWDGQQKEGDVAQVVDEDVNGVRVVKAYAQERRELDRVVSAASTLYGSQMRAVRLQSRYQPFLEAVPSLGQVAVLALGGYLAIRHEISLGTFLAFSTYLTQMVAPARMLAGILTIGQQARAGVERIFQLLDLPPAIVDAPGATEMAPIVGEVVFDRVNFSYEKGAPVLNELSLTIAAGETVALVGPSGSGKSTVANLLPRFYDVSSGAVRVDGVDVRDVSLLSLRRQIGVVFEECFLFSETVAENIAYGKPGRNARGDRGCRPYRRSSRVHRGAPSRLRDRGRRARTHLVGRTAPTCRPCPGDPLRPPHIDPRRRHERDRRHGGREDPRLLARAHEEPDDASRRPPTLDAEPGRPDRGPR